MADELEKRLESHGRAFEGLMSLIPAKLYYEQDNSDQWRKKKTTKEEKRAARKAKLDPRNIKSAKDVMDENERKRTREAGEEEDEQEVSDREGKERPLEGMKHANKNKKQKTSNESGEPSEEQTVRNAEKRREKRARQNEKRQIDKEKEKEKQKKRKEKLKPLIKATKVAKGDGTITTDNHINGEASHEKQAEQDGEEEGDDDVEDVLTSEAQEPEANVNNIIPEQASQINPTNDASTTPKPTISKPIDIVSSTALTRLSPSDISSNPDSTFSPALDQHTTTSESSIDDTTSNAKSSQIPQSSIKQKPSSLPEHKESKEVLRARLEAKIAALRAARKADGEDGKPIRTRQELIEHRRTKELERKQKKKKQREVNAAEDEAAQKASAEAELARLRGDTGSPITTAASSRSHSSDPLSLLPGGGPSTAVAKSKLNLDGLSYSRLSFADGEELYNGTPQKRKSSNGPIDPKSALAKAEARAARLASLDDATRADIESKELWQRARQRIAGEKVRDDVSLLKKTLKKREKQKSKSEREWNERKDGVAKAQEARQRKRETNLAKRREEKGGGSKKKGGSSKSGGAGGKKKNGGGMSSEKQKAKRAKQKAFG